MLRGKAFLSSLRNGEIPNRRHGQRSCVLAAKALDKRTLAANNGPPGAHMECGNMTDDREEFIRHLIARYKAGSLEKDYVLQGIAEYDALAATKRMRLYSLLSTIAAAISALASAVAAYFAYLGVHH